MKIKFEAPMKYFYLPIFLLFLQAAVCSQTNRQSSVKGIVLDAADNTPLPGASVFFTYTTTGTITDKNGIYELKNVNPGFYELVVSYVGYETQNILIETKTGTVMIIDVSLKPKPVEMKGIEIKGEEQEKWKDNLKLFKKYFLGSIEKEDDAVIENPEYIDFVWEKNNLHASCTKPMIVINNYLGYKIIVELKSFILGNNDRSWEYSFNSYYTELTPQDEDQRSKWEENRKNEFLGSPQHFLWALKNEKLIDEGFALSFTLEPHKARYRIRSYKEIPETKLIGSKVVFASDRPFSIQYKTKFSWIEFIGEGFTIDDNGIASNHLPFNVSMGAWLNLGLVNMLPRNYFPDEIKDKYKM